MIDTEIYFSLMNTDEIYSRCVVSESYPLGQLTVVVLITINSDKCTSLQGVAVCYNVFTRMSLALI